MSLFRILVGVWAASPTAAVAVVTAGRCATGDQMSDETLSKDVPSGYARLYGPLAVACVMLAFQPLFADVVYAGDPVTGERHGRG